MTQIHFSFSPIVGFQVAALSLKSSSVITGCRSIHESNDKKLVVALVFFNTKSLPILCNLRIIYISSCSVSVFSSFGLVSQYGKPVMLISFCSLLCYSVKCHPK